jgi:hypothetical protein
MKNRSDDSLACCCRLIEEKLGWHQPDSWSTQDFEQLSEEIALQTGISLSVTTLKRVWGRVKYTSAPTTTTLNALVQFVGYASWRDFENTLLTEYASGVESQQVTSAKAAELVRSGNSVNRRPWWIGVGLVAALAVILLMFLNYSFPKSLSADDFSFSSRPVTSGIPNSVVFRYDATASPTDSVFIQQSWDPSRRQRVSKNGHEYTSMYYYPGFFRAKLVIGTMVVREHDLFIPSEGWLAAVMQEPVPVYFNKSEVIRNGALGIPVAAIERQNIPMQPKPPTVRYRNVHRFNGLMNDNFLFETQVRSEYKGGAGICQHANIIILCKNDVFIIPLSAAGCVANLGLLLAGHNASATETDLSAFGVAPDQWVKVQCEARNKHVRLFVDGKKAYEADFPNEPTEIVGISYEFEGTGSVDYVMFSRLNGKAVFKDNFDSLQ